MTPMTEENVRNQILTCARCGRVHECTPWFDFYITPLWADNARVCEMCYRELRDRRHYRSVETLDVEL